MQSHNDTVDHQGDFLSVVTLFRYGKAVRKDLAIGIFLIVTSCGLLMLSAKLMGQLAETLTRNPLTETLSLLVLWILALEALNIAVYYQGRVRIAYVTNQVAFAIRKALFHKLTQLPIQYYDQQPLGRTITRLTADVEGIESFFSSTLPRVMTASITVVSVLVAMLLTDIKVGAIVTLSSLPSILFTISMRKPVRYWLREYKKKSASLNAKLAEFISGLSLIKIFGLEAWSEAIFRKDSEELLHSGYMMMNWNTFIRPLAALLCSIPIAVILYWGGHQVIDGLMSFGLLVAFIRYGERYFRPIMQLSVELHLIQDAIASSERICKLLDEAEEVSNLGPSGTVRNKLIGSIEFRDVRMSYDGKHDVLNGVSFTAEAGKNLALVGKSGSGKSTSVHLIPQLYPFESGDIFIDGIPLWEWDREFLRSHIGIVSQDVVIFHGTIRENLLITCDDPNAISEALLLEACERTGLNLVIKKLAKGLDSMAHEGGSNLSMGERQLIAFTRLLLRNPSILILDEATANIDEKHEELVQNAILELLKDRTCIIIAHRLSTIRNCDNILVFEKGRIIEQGPHDSLAKSEGTYAQLVRRQLVHGHLQTN